MIRRILLPNRSIRLDRSTASVRRNLSSFHHGTRQGSSSPKWGMGSFASLAAVGASAAATVTFLVVDTNTTKCDVYGKGADVVMLGPTAEPTTGILFPRLCNAMTFVGCGVRVKWRFVKVYAVGTYVDPIAFDYVKKYGETEIVKALLDPQFPRTIRVVMNRTVTMEKYMAAIIDALTPRMNGEDLDKLEDFKKLNPSGDLVEGAVMEMTIRGDTLLYRNSAGTVGAIHSIVFTR